MGAVGMRCVCTMVQQESDVVTAPYFLNLFVWWWCIFFMRIIWCVHLSPPGASGGGASSRDHRLRRFVIGVIRLARRHVVRISFEASAHSGRWRDADIRSELRAAGCRRVALYFCQYGAPYRRPTVLESSVIGVGALERRCRCPRHAFSLEGVCRVETGGARRAVRRSLWAERFPPELCQRLALVVARAAPPGPERGADEKAVDLAWEDVFAAAIGSPRPPQPPAPRCPRRLVVAWEARAGGRSGLPTAGGTPSASRPADLRQKRCRERAARALAMGIETQSFLTQRSMMPRAHEVYLAHVGQFRACLKGRPVRLEDMSETDVDLELGRYLNRLSTLR